MAYHSSHIVVIVGTENIGIEPGYCRMFRTFTVSGKLYVVNQPFHFYFDFIKGLFFDVALNHKFGFAFATMICRLNLYPQKFRIILSKVYDFGFFRTYF
jgi:hypothetical protein